MKGSVMNTRIEIECAISMQKQAVKRLEISNAITESFLSMVIDIDAREEFEFVILRNNKAILSIMDSIRWLESRLSSCK